MCSLKMEDLKCTTNFWNCPNAVKGGPILKVHFSYFFLPERKYVEMLYIEPLVGIVI